VTLVTLQSLLGWCALINYSVLLLWFVLYAAAGDALYHLHSRWFAISKERYDTFHLAGMTGFKLAIWLFNIAPYLALHLLH